MINSLAPLWFQWNFVWIIFKLISVIGGRDMASEIVLRWLSLDLSDDKSTLVQVMAWCHQATSHYLSQCWPRSLSPLGPNELTLWNCQNDIFRSVHLQAKRQIFPLVNIFFFFICTFCTIWQICITCTVNLLLNTYSELIKCQRLSVTTGLV